MCHFAGQMWGGGGLEKKIACALDCISKGAAALSEAGNAVYTMSHAIQSQGITGLLQQELWNDAPNGARNLAPNTAQPQAQSAAARSCAEGEGR